MPTTKIRRLVATLAFFIASATAVIGSSASPAQAAGCYGNSCTGQNPVSMGCNADARTIDQFTSGFRVELRYSPACHAAWAKATGTASSSYRAAIHGFNSRTAPYPYVVYGTGTPTPDGTYSLMVSFNSWVAACQEFAASGWSTQRCTARH